MSLPLQFSHTFHRPFWNTVLDPEQGLLLIEFRDAATRGVSYAAIDLEREEGGVLWQEKELWRGAQSWWMGLTGVWRGILLAHHYPDSTRPETKGIWAVDARTGQPRWEQPEWTFLRVEGDLIRAFRTGAEPMPEAVQYGTLDLLRGTVLSVSDEPAKVGADPPAAPLQYPLHYTEESPYFSPVAQFLASRLGVRPVKAFDYAQCRDWLVVSYYLCVPEGYQNHLLVLDRQGREHLHEMMTSQLNGVGLNTFLIRDNCLIFIREKKTLISYRLT